MSIIDSGKVGIGFTQSRAYKGYSRLPDFSALLKLNEAVRAEDDKLAEANKKADPGLEAIISKWNYEGLISDVNKAATEDSQNLQNGYNAILDYYNGNTSLAVVSPEFKNLINKTMVTTTKRRNEIKQRFLAYGNAFEKSEKNNVGNDISYESIVDPSPSQYVDSRFIEVKSVGDSFVDRQDKTSWLGTTDKSYPDQANFGQMVSMFHDIYRTAGQIGGGKEVIGKLNSYVDSGSLSAEQAAGLGDLFGTVSSQGTSNKKNLDEIQTGILNYLDQSQLKTLALEYLKAKDGANAIKLDSQSGSMYMSQDDKSEYFSRKNMTDKLITEAKQWATKKGFGKEGTLISNYAENLGIMTPKDGGSDTVEKHNRIAALFVGAGNKTIVGEHAIADNHGNITRETADSDVPYTVPEVNNVMGFSNAPNDIGIYNKETGGMSVAYLTPEQQANIYIIGNTGRFQARHPLNPDGTINTLAHPEPYLSETYAVTNSSTITDVVKNMPVHTSVFKKNAGNLTKLIAQNNKFLKSTTIASIYNQLKSSYTADELISYGLNPKNTEERTLPEIFKIINDAASQKVTTAGQTKGAGWNIETAWNDTDSDINGFGRAYLESIGVKRVEVSPDDYKEIDKQGYPTFSSPFDIAVDIGKTDNNSKNYDAVQLTNYKTWLDNQMETNMFGYNKSGYVWMLPMSVNATGYANQAQRTPNPNLMQLQNLNK